MKTATTTKQAEQREAEQFLRFVDNVAVALFGRVFKDCAPMQRTAVLEQVEAIHMAEVI